MNEMHDNRIYNELYETFYDLHVMERMDEAGIYRLDRFTYNEILDDCDRLHSEYTYETSCCNPRKQDVVEDIKENDEPSCDHERNIYDLFYRVRDEIISKWFHAV